MLEFKSPASKIWLIAHAINFAVLPTFKGYDMRINGIIFSEPTPEFVIAFNKEKVWEELTGVI